MSLNNYRVIEQFNIFFWNNKYFFCFYKDVSCCLIKDAVQSDLRMCTKEPSFYYKNILFRFLFHFMFLQSLIVVSW